MTDTSVRQPKWYERANEASFKPTAGGHVFQAPSPWVFARPRYYLVTEAQKAQLLEGLRRWRLILLMASLLNAAVLVGFVLPMILWPKTLAPYFLPLLRAVGPVGLGIAVAVAMGGVMAPLIVAAQIHLARTLRTGLAGAPLTDERIKVSEQLPRIARSASRLVIAAGLIGGALMIAGGAMQLIDAQLEGHLARAAPWSGFMIACGLMVTAYFLWLVRLRMKQNRVAVG